MPDVLGDEVRVLGVPGGVGCQHARGHPFDDVPHVAARRGAGCDGGPGGGDGPAGVVTQHHHQGAAEHTDPVLDAAEHLRPGDVARGPHHEHVTEPLVEDDLGGEAGVGAAEQHRERCLGGRGLGPAGGVLVRVLGYPGDEPVVPGQQRV